MSGSTDSAAPQRRCERNACSQPSDLKNMINKFRIDPSSRMSRKSAPKARTGCITCKKRHTRCDEERPHCRKCLMRHGCCEGYQTADAESQSQLIASQISARTNSTTQMSFRPLDRCIFTSDREQRYFETWVRFSKVICGDGLSELCSNAITQLSFTDPAIREATLAIGCLRVALDDRPTGVLGSSAVGTPSYGEAIHRYAAALRKVVSSPLDKTTIRTVLLCCILFICFDILDGNRPAVHNHIFHGLRILQQFLRSVHPQANCTTHAPSPDPSTVDGFILQIFQRLTMISHSQLALHQQSLWQSTPSSPQQPISAMTRITGPFNNLADAARWLDAIYKSLLEATRAYRGDISGIAKDATWREQRVLLMKLLHAWDASSAGTLQKARMLRDDDPESFSHALMLRLQWIVAFTSVKASQCTDYENLVAVTAYFEEIVLLAEQLPRTDVRKTTPFTICSPVFALFHAERLLGTLEQTDGLWDNRAALALVKWGRELEAEYDLLFSNAAEAWATTRQRFIVFHEHEDKMTAGALRLREGRWVMVQDIISCDPYMRAHPASAVTCSARTASVRRVPKPVPAENEVLVRVQCVALNLVDSLYVAEPLGSTGRTVGSDWAGIILESNVSHLLRGTRVAGFLQGASSVNNRPGAFAEYLVCPPDLLWKVPDTMSMKAASTVSLCALTAAQGLFYRLQLPSPFPYAEPDRQTTRDLVQRQSTEGQPLGADCPFDEQPASGRR
ncbi:hypothetical protein Micbo1qcDRAFT_172560 [Microdochium bolleyi]|uniref:Zn(2)-C6 fungal-type domain-containing protein n=1 Tax=Microdochium bolleyi TaxID=196109 RepID=A0A136J906_9PEZI|nr:hypothetical protein Micbo1qcDRAFT_172560 [Microdochium bolleyi]